MKNLILTTLFAASALTVSAQLEIPALSPKAMVMQTVGLTEISIDYSSPAVKKRKIFGELVPYDSLWRTGANASTKVTFSRPVKIGDSTLAAGTYSLLTIPGKNNWTVIFNKNKDAGTGNYKQSEDAVRLKVKEEKAEMREHLVFMITDFDNDKASIVMEWDNVKITIPVKVNTHEQTMKSIENTLNPSARAYANSARYLLDNDKDLDLALKYIDQSIAAKEDWFNNWIKAQILYKQGKVAEAKTFAQKAWDLGNPQGGAFFYRSDVEKALKTWK